MRYRLKRPRGLEIAEGNYVRRFEPGKEFEITPGEILRLERLLLWDRFEPVESPVAESAPSAPNVQKKEKGK